MEKANSTPTPKPQEESDKIINLENKINNLTERIIFLENKLEKLESKKEVNLHGTTGKILKTEEEFKELFSFISGNNERQFRLLYSPTFDTNTKEDFHKNCDNKGSTIVLVETSNGRRFGGFTSLSWKSNDQWVNDPCACIFSFDTHKKYKLLLPQYSYYGGPGYGPHFGHGDVVVSRAGPADGQQAWVFLHGVKVGASHDDGVGIGALGGHGVLRHVQNLAVYRGNIVDRLDIIHALHTPS